LRAFSTSTLETDSRRAGEAVGRALSDAFGSEPLRAVLLYTTVNHDQAALLEELRRAIGAGVPVVGCSGQGIMSRGLVVESGFAVGAMGFGGDDLRAAAALERDIQTDPAGKGRRLGQAVKRQLGGAPALLVLLYDPLSGVDVPELLGGVRAEVDCPIAGGGASQPLGPMVKTLQYFDDQVLSRSAIAFAIRGPFTAEVGLCHGTSPTGIRMTVDRAEGTRLLELDGRPALRVFRESLGCTEEDGLSQELSAALALGVERPIVKDGKTESGYLIRATFGFDEAEGALMVQAAIPAGTKIMFHHRTVQAVLQGTAAMARELRARIDGRHAWAVLGFECGARTAPFLGPTATLEENLALQREVAPQAPWLGLLAWGEIGPCGDEPGFHNYTYPLVVLTAAR
jgi:hypothetical protein